MNEFENTIEKLEQIVNDLRIMASDIELTVINVKKAHMASEDSKARESIASYAQLKSEYGFEGLDRKEKKAWKRLIKVLKRKGSK